MDKSDSPHAAQIDAGGSLIQIEVIYCAPENEMRLQLDVVSGTSVNEVLHQLQSSTFSDPEFSHLDLLAHPVGIWGRQIDGSTALQSGDRLEIYRPLQADAKTARRLRAARQRQALTPTQR